MRQHALLYIGNADDACRLAQLPRSQLYLTTPPDQRFTTCGGDALGLKLIAPGRFAALGPDTTLYVVCRQTTDGRHILARNLGRHELPNGAHRAGDRPVSAWEFADFMEDLRPPIPIRIAFPPGFSPVGKLLFRYHLTLGGRRVTCLFHEQPWLPESRGALRDLL
ncbi:hypothetical protein CHELA1G11_14545 [Hyphomicrobiales bacterium]|nr:hypothetical protein CHELA1G11_14545 [Hyphomicrobiales bacterium]CAH1679549.1 hypothetical protein CHELA1G2_14564 [Hyphomicrobiales bacterium]